MVQTMGHLGFCIQERDALWIQQLQGSGQLGFMSGTLKVSEKMKRGRNECC